MDIEETFQSGIKEKLRSRIFLGSFEKKSYISAISDYRNVILLGASETELLSDLVAVRREIEKFYKNSPHWIGFEVIDATTGTLYIDQLEDVPFGTFWFQIKTVRFKDGEVKLKLKILRKVESSETSFDRSTSKSLNNDSTNSTATWKEIFDLWLESANVNIKNLLLHKFTVENCIKFMQMVPLVMISIFIGGFHLIQFVGDFCVRMMPELTRLVHACTPIFFGILDLISRIIGGFFILISMIWKDSIGGGAKPRQPAIKYPVNRIQ
ncbi:uncharacterized protein LOC134831529 [Culicoides brevitarsis]|uniref:uncharacterized protein LOC134831529 n=1 Tax=Culicoides brevitarsis TaxID=469753 RepID=UPI00307C78E7